MRERGRKKERERGRACGVIWHLRASGREEREGYRGRNGGGWEDGQRWRKGDGDGKVGQGGMRRDETERVGRERVFSGKQEERGKEVKIEKKGKKEGDEKASPISKCGFSNREENKIITAELHIHINCTHRERDSLFLDASGSVCLYRFLGSIIQTHTHEIEENISIPFRHQEPYRDQTN